MKSARHTSSWHTSMTGFTILELIIVVAVISLVSFVSAPLGLEFYNSQTIDSIQGQLGEMLTKARSQSIVQKADGQYGVYMVNDGGIGGTNTTTPSYILYRGASFAAPARDTSADESYVTIPGTLITFPASSTEINFAKHTGTPSATGTISVIWNGLTRRIVVDSFGTVQEQ